MAARIKIDRSCGGSSIGREKSCQIAPHLARGTCQFAPVLHMAFTSVSTSLDASIRSPRRSRRGKECEPRVLRANSAGFRTVSISQTNRGHLRGLAYQVARNWYQRDPGTVESPNAVSEARNLCVCLSLSCDLMASLKYSSSWKTGSNESKIVYL